MKIVFFGTPSIAANILDRLLKNGVEVVAVVTKPDKPQGRSQKMQSSAVKSLVKKSYPHIPVLEPVKVSTLEWQSVLEKYQADLFVVVAYGEIIKQNILNIPKKGALTSMQAFFLNIGGQLRFIELLSTMKRKVEFVLWRWF